jgi:hypothetical protein
MSGTTASSATTTVEPSYLHKQKFLAERTHHRLPAVEKLQRKTKGDRFPDARERYCGGKSGLPRSLKGNF